MTDLHTHGAATGTGDRRGPAPCCSRSAPPTAGSAVGTLSLVIVAWNPNLPVFFVGWILAGLAMATTFYHLAFAAVTRWWAPDHVRALTIVTLAGGLASTVFAPLTAALADRLSWRSTYLVLAMVLAAVTIPAHDYPITPVRNWCGTCCTR